jgi:glycosyltransferase involved in cell wall biosynthesis
MTESPLVSVVLPVYNSALHLRESIQSILDQTYTNFELIILNDGSTDQSEEIILSFNDARIHYVKNDNNLKLIKTLNIGFELAKGTYIARMDADDISIPDRLAIQISFLELQPTIGFVGTSFEKIGDEIGEVHYPVKNDDLRLSSVFFNPFLHPSVVLRNSVLKKFNLYFKEAYIHAEEYKLWTELLLVTEGANISESLIKYRVHANQISQVFVSEQIKTSKLIAREYLIAAGFVFTSTEWELILTLHELTFKETSLSYFFAANSWISQNTKNHFFNSKILEDFVIKKCKNILINQTALSLKSYFKIIKTDLFKLIHPTNLSKLLYLKKVIKFRSLYNI